MKHKFKTATAYIKAHGKMTTNYRHVKCDICKSVMKCSKVTVERHVKYHGTTLDKYAKRLIKRGYKGPTPHLVEIDNEDKMSQSNEKELELLALKAANASLEDRMKKLEDQMSVISAGRKVSNEGNEHTEFES